MLYEEAVKILTRKLVDVPDGYFAGNYEGVAIALRNIYGVERLQVYHDMSEGYNIASEAVHGPSGLTITVCDEREVV